MSERIDLDEEQATVVRLADALWPGETIEEAALALCEEAGEVARAVIKRNHADRSEGDRPPTDWTANLRDELAQVVIVAMKMAEREGFSLSEAIVEQMAALDRRRNALLDLEDGGESSVRALLAPPMSPTMRQAVAEAKQRPPARHFEPSTLLEDGGVDE